MWRLPLILLILFSGAACSPNPPAATATPLLPPTLSGTVEISIPQAASVIYAEALYLAGTAENIPNQQFKIKLLDPEGLALTQVDVAVQEDGKWQVELVHGYTGDPTEITIAALPSYTDAPADTLYAERSVLLAGHSARPEGTFGSITAPLANDTIGGDFIQVSGTVSGVFENTFTVELRAEDGAVIDQKLVTATNPYFIDEVPWTAELLTSAYTGPATIRAYALSARDGSEIPLADVSIILSRTAG